jgi:hypothetical protein
MKAELARRQSLEDALYAYILAHPRSWLPWSALASCGGQAWRSRLPQVRARLADLDLVFVWNGRNGNASAYMLRAAPLGRDAAEQIAQVSLF